MSGAGECTMSGCSKPVADGRAKGGLCEEHIPNTDPEPEPTTESAESTQPATGPWSGAEFDNPGQGVYATDRLGQNQWMGRKGKQPFSPWADRNAPAECSTEGHTTADKCGCDARWKWGYGGNYTDGESLAMYEDDPLFQTDGRVFIQREDDPFAYVDGDDVRDPETGEVHPAFVDALNQLGLTTADISQSDAGVHAAYRGELPEDVKQAAWQLDDEPFGENDDLPSIEIYARKRVCVETGKHVPGTPTETHEWDDDALLDLLNENGQLPEHPPIPSRDQFDAVEYDADATTTDETADDIRDVYAALDRLNTHHVADKTIVHRWNDDASTSEGTRAFAPTWGKNSNGTANIVTEKIWQDTGDEAGYGGPVVMALIDLGEMSHRNASPRQATGGLWLKGVEHLRELGFDIPQFDPSTTAQSDGGEIVATLPDSPRTRAAAKGSRWYDERDAESDTLQQQDVYNRVRQAISDGMERYDQFVLDAIMGGGKTFNFFGALADRDENGAYFAPRIELYEQAVEYATENGIPQEECYILPSIKRDCGVWQGEHGQDQEHLVKRLYALGVQPKTIHNLLADKLGCKKNDSGKCEYEHKCNFEPDEYQLLIGHYAHAHLPHVTKKRHCAFDEDPQNAFTTHLGGSELIKGVNAFLNLHESPDYDGWDDLIQHRNDRDRRERGLAWFDRPEFDFEPDERNAVRFEEDGFHAYAPLAVYAILNADPIEEGYPFERASLPGLGNSAQFFSTSEQNGEHYVEMSTPPDLEYANAIIALDGTPLMHDGSPVEWENALDRPMNYRQVLTNDERTEFLSETQGNVYLQTSDHIKPYSSGRWNHAQEDAALLAAIREAYGDGDPAVVFTDKKVRDQYEELEFVEKGLAKTFDHPGNLRGSDEYGDSRLAVQLGSSHHGDHEVRRRAALLGATIDPEGKGKDRDYGSDIGNKLVYQMREAQSAQNALRVGRDGEGALFVFDTSAFPDWIPVEGGVADVSVWNETEQQIREAWAEIPKDERAEGVRSDPIIETFDGTTSPQYIRRCLGRLADRGYLEKQPDPDDGRRSVWVDTGLGSISDHESAEVDLPELDFNPPNEESAEEVRYESQGYSSLYVRLSYFAPTRSTSDSAIEASDAAASGVGVGGVDGGGT